MKRDQVSSEGFPAFFRFVLALFGRNVLEYLFFVFLAIALVEWLVPAWRRHRRKALFIATAHLNALTLLSLLSLAAAVILAGAACHAATASPATAPADAEWSTTAICSSDGKITRLPNPFDAEAVPTSFKVEQDQNDGRLTATVDYSEEIYQVRLVAIATDGSTIKNDGPSVRSWWKPSGGTPQYSLLIDLGKTSPGQVKEYDFQLRSRGDSAVDQGWLCQTTSLRQRDPRLPNHDMIRYPLPGRESYRG